MTENIPFILKNYALYVPMWLQRAYFCIMEQNNSPNKYMRYAGAGTQMLVTIGAGVFLGNWLDEKFMMKTPWFTIGCSLFFIFAGMYLFIKSLPKE